MKKRIYLSLLLAATLCLTMWSGNNKEKAFKVDHNTEDSAPEDSHVQHKTIDIDGVEIFYREAGNKEAPTLLLLHGYPTSSHMFRNLIRDLSKDFHLLAPDYPGYGRSAQPKVGDFDYTFANMADIIDKFLLKLEVDRYSLYLMDYGAPIGFRVFAKHPEKVTSFIIQNGNAYEEGLDEFWNPIKKYWNEYTLKNGKALEPFHSLEGLQWQYLHGVQDSTKVSPDNWEIDLRHLQRPENDDIQLAMFYDYRTNVSLYKTWQELFRKHQPPTLIVWGQNDYIFPPVGAHPYKRDLKKVEFNLIDTGHFALEEHGEFIAKKIIEFKNKYDIK